MRDLYNHINFKLRNYVLIQYPAKSNMSQENLIVNDEELGIMKNKLTMFFDQDRWFVKYATNQARSVGHNVVRLRNHPNDIPGCRKAEIPDEKISKMNDLYIHLSDNPHKAEYYALVRWFYFEKYMRENNVTEALICDSDVLIFVGPEEIWNYFEIEENEIGLLCKGNRSFSGGTCLISLSNLSKFCDHILYQYQNNRKYLKYARSAGDNISDITFFNKFITKYEDLEPVCLNDYSHNLVIDDSSIVKNHMYKFKNELPTVEAHKCKIAALHYQGSTKYLMPFHYANSTKLELLKNIHRILIYWANSKTYTYSMLRKLLRRIGVDSQIFNL